MLHAGFSPDCFTVLANIDAIPFKRTSGSVKDPGKSRTTPLTRRGKGAPLSSLMSSGAGSLWLTVEGRHGLTRQPRLSMEEQAMIQAAAPVLHPAGPSWTDAREVRLLGGCKTLSGIWLGAYIHTGRFRVS